MVRQFQRVATTTVLAMVRQHPQQAEKHLLRPLLKPLLRCLGEPGNSLPPPGQAAESDGA